MADIGQQQNWLVSPNKEVEDMWMKVRIQEKKSQLAGYRRSIKECEQKIEDLKEGVMVDLTAKAIMIEKEISFLELKSITIKGGESNE
jgi:hypothetical protein